MKRQALQLNSLFVWYLTDGYKEETRFFDVEIFDRSKGLISSGPEPAKCLLSSNPTYMYGHYYSEYIVNLAITLQTFYIDCIYILPNVGAIIYQHSLAILVLICI